MRVVFFPVSQPPSETAARIRPALLPPPPQMWVFGGRSGHPVLSESESRPPSAPRVSGSSSRDAVDRRPGEQARGWGSPALRRRDPGTRPSSVSACLPPRPRTRARSLTRPSTTHSAGLSGAASGSGRLGRGQPAGGPASLREEDATRGRAGTGGPGSRVGAQGHGMGRGETGVRGGHPVHFRPLSGGESAALGSAGAGSVRQRLRFCSRKTRVGRRAGAECAAGSRR